MKGTVKMDKNAQSYFNAVAQLPQSISNVLSCVPQDLAKKVTEIRLRSNRPLVLTTTQGYLLLDRNGNVMPSLSINTFCTSHDDINECFKAVCAYSVHSYQNYIINGFVPLKGGHRVGISGTAVCDNDKIDTIKNVSSLNVRIARTEITDCDNKIKLLLQKNNGGIILAGEPGSGKTTVLRSVMRHLSDAGKRVVVIDERFEIAPVSPTGFALAVPMNCDIMSGYPKHIGMIQAVRSLAPDVILCDEIGSFADVNAVKMAANAGVDLFITMHGNNINTIKRRPQAKAILQTGAFSSIAFLHSNKIPGVVREVFSVATSI